MKKSKIIIGVIAIILLLASSFQQPRVIIVKRFTGLDDSEEVQSYILKKYKEGYKLIQICSYAGVSSDYSRFIVVMER